MKPLFKLFVVSCVALSANAFCNLHDTSLYSPEVEFIAVNLEDLDITPEGIFMNRNGEWIQLQSIVQDSSGNMVGMCRSNLKLPNPKPWKWTCSNCGFKNAQPLTRCEMCGHKP